MTLFISGINQFLRFLLGVTLMLNFYGEMGAKSC